MYRTRPLNVCIFIILNHFHLNLAQFATSQQESQSNSSSRLENEIIDQINSNKDKLPDTDWENVVQKDYLINDDKLLNERNNAQDIGDIFPADFRRTQIFIRALTEPGQYVFIRGGINIHVGRECNEDDTQNDPCAIPIHHRIRPDVTDSSYYQLSKGDYFLDWNGAEESQGNYSGAIPVPAVGTPMMWTTNEDVPFGGNVDVDGYGYTPYNRFGEHYWFVDLDMDCSATENMWFEFKTYRILDGWEEHINQYERCGGQVTSYRPYETVNHIGLCGKMNVFFENKYECSIYDIPSDGEGVPDACGHTKMFEDESSTGLPPNYIKDSSQITQISALANSSNTEPFIVGGSPASLGRWPWQGVLQYDDVIGGCGAVLIDPLWALTAAHCVWNTWPAALKVRTGEQNLAVEQGHEQVLQVLRIHLHECYRSDDCGDIPYNDYDLAILQLQEPADLNNHVTNIACLPHNYGLDDFVGDECVATGFGDTKGTGYRYRLHQAVVPVHSHSECVQWWGESSITTRQLCMGTHNTSACGGDSGSPLVCWKEDHWVLTGVTSWGSSDCANNPSVYSRVTEFMEWIYEVTGLARTYCKNH